MTDQSQTEDEEEFELEGVTSREAGATVLRRLGDGVENGSVELGGDEGTVPIPDQFEAEYEREEDEAELEVELTNDFRATSSLRWLTGAVYLPAMGRARAKRISTAQARVQQPEETATSVIGRTVTVPALQQATTEDVREPIPPSPSNAVRHI